MNRSQQLLRPFGQGGGSPYTPGYEYKSLNKFFGVFGLSVDLSGLGGVVSANFDWSAAIPSAASFAAALNAMLGSGRAEVVDKLTYFEIKFVGDLAEYDIPEMTLTPDASYPANDGTGTYPTKTSQRNYSAPVSGNPEVVTIFLSPSDGFSDASQGDSNGNSISYNSGGFNYTSFPAGSDGWSVTSGDGTGLVTFTCGVNGPKNTSAGFGSNNGAPSPVNVDTAGVADAPEVLGQVVGGWVGTGWITYSSDSPAFTVAIPTTASNAEVLAILNDASRYNGTVTSVSMTATTLTLDFTTLASPGTVTIGGVVGASEPTDVDTLQDGANALPVSPFSPFDIASLELWLDPYNDVFSDAGTTPAVENDPVYQVNDQTANATHDVQTTLASRPLYVMHGGKPRFLYDGGNDYTVAPVAAYQTSTTVIVYEYVTVGGSVYRLIMAYGTPGNGQLIYHGQSNSNKEFIGNDSGATECLGATLDTNQHVSTANRTPTTFAGFIDGVQIDTTKTTSGTMGSGLVTGGYNSTPLFTANAYVGDRFIFSTILTTDEMTDLLAFLVGR